MSQTALHDHVEVLLGREEPHQSTRNAPRIKFDVDKQDDVTHRNVVPHQDDGALSSTRRRIVQAEAAHGKNSVTVLL